MVNLQHGSLGKREGLESGKDKAEKAWLHKKGEGGKTAGWLHSGWGQTRGKGKAGRQRGPGGRRTLYVNRKLL